MVYVNFYWLVKPCPGGGHQGYPTLCNHSTPPVDRPTVVTKSLPLYSSSAVGWCPSFMPKPAGGSFWCFSQPSKCCFPQVAPQRHLCQQRRLFSLSLAPFQTTFWPCCGDGCQWIMYTSRKDVEKWEKEWALDLPSVSIWQNHFWRKFVTQQSFLLDDWATHYGFDSHVAALRHHYDIKALEQSLIVCNWTVVVTLAEGWSWDLSIGCTCFLLEPLKLVVITRRDPADLRG